MEISTKKYHMWVLVLKLNSRLSFLSPFTGGKKCLEFPLDGDYGATLKALINQQFFDRLDDDKKYREVVRWEKSHYCQWRENFNHSLDWPSLPQAY